jgi:hypothetical protein
MDHESGGTGGDGSTDFVERRSADRSMSVRDLEEMLRGYEASGDPRSERYQSALILLASTMYGQNVDLLARRTGIPRPLVSRVARRLIDNGVWQSGSTAVSWAVGEEPGEAFWNDVGVAEGRMCRRNGTDGETEWAPAGFWNKSFQFVDPEADGRLSSTYHNAGAPEPVIPAKEPAAGVVPEPEPAVPARTGPTSAVPRNEPRSPWLDDLQDVEVIGVSASTDPGTVVAGPLPTDAPPEELPASRRLLTTVPSLDELFGNVTWIG